MAFGKKAKKDDGGKAKAGKKGKRVSALAKAVAESESEQGRTPLFDEGTFRAKFVACEERPPIAGKDTWMAVQFVGAGDDEEIGERAALFCTSSRSLGSTAPRIKSLCMALVGLSKDDEEQYDEFDPHGEFCDAVTTGELEAAAAYLSENGPGKMSEDEALEALQNAEVLVVVTRGNETSTGDWYRNVSFRPVADEADEDEEDEPKAKTKASKSAGKKRKPVEDEDDEDEDEDDEDSDSDEDEDEDEAQPSRKSKASKRRK